MPNRRGAGKEARNNLKHGETVASHCATVNAITGGKRRKREICVEIESRRNVNGVELTFERINDETPCGYHSTLSTIQSIISDEKVRPLEPRTLYRFPRPGGHSSFGPNQFWNLKHLGKREDRFHSSSQPKCRNNVRFSFSSRDSLLFPLRVGPSGAKRRIERRGFRSTYRPLCGGMTRAHRWGWAASVVEWARGKATRRHCELLSIENNWVEIIVIDIITMLRSQKPCSSAHNAEQTFFPGCLVLRSTETRTRGTSVSMAHRLRISLLYGW